MIISCTRFSNDFTPRYGIFFFLNQVATPPSDLYKMLRFHCLSLGFQLVTHTRPPIVGISPPVVEASEAFCLLGHPEATLPSILVPAVSCHLEALTAPSLPIALSMSLGVSALVIFGIENPMPQSTACCYNHSINVILGLD